MNATERALDVSQLPNFAYSHRSPMWWGTLGMITIEGTVFALAIATYFFLRMHAQTWPMYAPPPDLLWGTLNVAVLVLSLIPNELAKKASERQDLHATQLWLVVGLLFGAAFLVVRVLEFPALNTRWDTSAYGSIVWTLMGLHTAHLATEFLDTCVLTVLMFTGPLDGRRYVDVSENASYWYFVVGSWIPIYLVIYWGARVVG